MTNEEKIEVPEWVINHFKEPQAKKPTQRVGFGDKDALTLSYAEREANLAAQYMLILSDPEKVAKQMDRLAENLLIQGLFDKALEVAQSEDLKARIISYKQAVEQEDDKFCDCRNDESQLERDNKTISRFRVVQRIYSPKHGKMVDVKQCRKCLFVNATDLTEEGA